MEYSATHTADGHAPATTSPIARPSSRLLPSSSIFLYVEREDGRGVLLPQKSGCERTGVTCFLRAKSVCVVPRGMVLVGGENTPGRRPTHPQGKNGPLRGAGVACGGPRRTAYRLVPDSVR